jgi:Leucine-rich repeat (LRR) protein
LPQRLFGKIDYKEEDVSFENSSTGWWEQVDLIRLIAADNQISFIDHRIGDLKALCVLDLHNNQLKSIPTEIRELENLALLQLSSNQLSAFPIEICSLPLVELYLGSNEIQSIPPEMGLLKKLAKLDLSRNQIAKLPLEFADMISLQECNLSYNSLHTIDCDFNSLFQLKVLNFSNNQLHFISTDTLSLPRLKIIDLKYNQLSKWEVILKCPELKDFCISFNKLHEIRPGSFICPELEIFDIRDNGIAVVPADVLKFYQLKRLDLSNNAISVLPPELSLLKQLNALHYSGNPLRGLPSSGGVTKLMEFLSKKMVFPTEKSTGFSTTKEQQPLPFGDSKLIDWSGMGLMELDLSPLIDSGLKPISINVSNNALKSIPSEMNQIGSAIQTLLFSKNRLMIFPMLLCSQLTTLDLSNNQIDSFPSKLESLPFLNELNLNGNRISKLPMFPFPKLSILLVSANSLTEIDMDVLEALPHLQILDMSNNSISMVPPILGRIKLTSLQLMGNSFRIPRTYEILI